MFRELQSLTPSPIPQELKGAERGLREVRWAWMSCRKQVLGKWCLCLKSWCSIIEMIRVNFREIF